MLLWISVILFVLFVALAIFTKKASLSYKAEENLGHISFAGITVSFVFLFVMTVYALQAKDFMGTHELEIKNTRDTIEYKIESGSYKDSFGIVDNKIINEIREYNTTIEKAHIKLNNIFTYNLEYKFLEDFETIDMKRLED